MKTKIKKVGVRGTYAFKKQQGGKSVADYKAELGFRFKDLNPFSGIIKIFKKIIKKMWSF